MSKSKFNVKKLSPKGMSKSDLQERRPEMTSKSDIQSDVKN